MPTEDRAAVARRNAPLASAARGRVFGRRFLHNQMRAVDAQRMPGTRRSAGAAEESRRRRGRAKLSIRRFASFREVLSLANGRGHSADCACSARMVSLLTTPRTIERPAPP